MLLKMFTVFKGQMDTGTQFKELISDYDCPQSFNQFIQFNDNISKEDFI